jgi:hypothetical protein
MMPIAYSAQLSGGGDFYGKADAATLGNALVANPFTEVAVELGDRITEQGENLGPWVTKANVDALRQAGLRVCGWCRPRHDILTELARVGIPSNDWIANIEGIYHRDDLLRWHAAIGVACTAITRPPA